MELRLQNIPCHDLRFHLQGRIAEIMCRHRRRLPRLDTVPQLFSQISELILITERMKIICRHMTGISVFRNIKQRGHIIIVWRNAQIEIFG